MRFSPSTISPAQTTSPEPLRTTAREPACAPTRVTRIGFGDRRRGTAGSGGGVARVHAGRAVQHRRRVLEQLRRLGGEQPHHAPGHHQGQHDADQQRPVRDRRPVLRMLPVIPVASSASKTRRALIGAVA